MHPRSLTPRFLAASILLLATLAQGCTALRWSAPDEHRQPTPNVILLIADGLGAPGLTMARNYHVGANGRLAIDRLPVHGWCTTHAVREDDPARPDYVTDSAASATAIATGRKTSNRRLATEPQTDAAIPTILEQARDAGLRTGLVSTASLADATPAAFAAHVNYRWCYDPAMMAGCPTFTKMSGGLGSIVEQLVDARPDVLLGGGMGSFRQRIAAGPDAGRRVVEAARAAGYRVVDSADELGGLEPGAPVLGLFADGNLAPAWKPSLASFPPGEAERCEPGNRPPRQPSFTAMLEAALRHLEPAAADRAPGFFLMAEAAMIDKQAHVADACGQIGDTVEFDEGVALARAFAERHPGTLLIVVGDHDHTPQIVDPAYAEYSPGITTTLTTFDGSPMTIAYATSFFGLRQQHTGSQLPLVAMGPGAERLGGLVDHADLYHLMREHLGLARPAAGGDEALQP